MGIGCRDRDALLGEPPPQFTHANPMIEGGLVDRKISHQVRDGRPLSSLASSADELGDDERG